MAWTRVLLAGVLLAARGPAPAAADAAVPAHHQNSLPHGGGHRTPKALAPGPGGATYTDRDISGLLTVWGHNDSHKGVDRIGEEALQRVDLLRLIRDHATSPGCRRALDHVLEARDRLQMWALQMHSASVALPDALLAGTVYNLGDFDGCLSVPDSMYCLLDAEVRPAAAPGTRLTEHAGDELSPYQPPHGSNATLWDMFKTSGNRRRLRRDLQQWALCVPSACGREPGVPEAAARRRLGEAAAGAVRGLGRSLGVDLLLHLDPADCTAPSQQDANHTDVLRALRNRPDFLAASLALLAFPVLVAAVSLRDWREDYWPRGAAAKQHAAGALAKVLRCFSVGPNWNKLSQRQDSDILSIQGVRTVTMVLITFSHSVLYTICGPLRNPDYVEDSYGFNSRMLLINGAIVVSTFFVISGFLEARLSMRHLGKMRRFSLPVVFVHYVIRFARLLPGLAVMLAVEVFWVEMMGSGPMWNQVVGRGVRDCKDNWWAHLLFINNYYSPDSRCLIQTWFASAVLQLYLATPLLMWLVSRWTLRAKWPGFLLLGALLVAAAAAYVVSTVSQGLHPMLFAYPQVLRRKGVFSDPTFTHQYVATHANAVPYVVGLIVGTLFYLASHRQWRPTKVVGRVMWCGIPLGFLLQLATLMSAAVFYLPSFRERPLLDAMYGPARQLAFSVPTAWLLFTCSVGAGGAVNTLMTWTPVLVTGRLTYSVYLSHLTLINVRAGYVRQPVVMSTVSSICQAGSDVVYAYVLGLVLYLCVEAPMSNVQALVFGYFFEKAGVTDLLPDKNPKPAVRPGTSTTTDGGADQDVRSAHDAEVGDGDGEDASGAAAGRWTRRSSSCTSKL